VYVCVPQNKKKLSDALV